ncbi:MAG: hypothetical protein ACU843_02025 [Gammaproteobacteria bacterium]
MRIIRNVLVIFVLLSLVSCQKNLFKPQAAVLPAHIVPGETYYTQFVIRYEKGTHLTTNYRRGDSIPANTPIKLLNISDDTIEVESLPSMQKLLIKNVEKHTGDDVYRAFDKLFAKQKIDLAKFNSLEREEIQKGTVAKGMSKAAVIVAIGYPPITQTASLDNDLWVYWSGRFNRFNVHFTNGRVSNIKD